MRGLNIGSGPFKAGEGWVNTDMDPSVEPDHHCTDIWDQPEGPFDRIYLGHVLEHIPWESVPAYIEWVWNDLVGDGGELAVVGPDVYMTMRLFPTDDTRIRSVLEDHVSWQEDRPGEASELRHHWNCYQQRLTWLMERCGVPGRAVSLAHLEHEGWPLTSAVRDQCSWLSAAKG